MAITFGVNLSVDNYWDVPEFVWRAEDLDSPAANTPTVTSTPPPVPAVDWPVISPGAIILPEG